MPDYPEAALVKAVAELGLDLQPHPLRQLPKGGHWHIRKPGHSGTLEVTWNDGLLWTDVRRNRSAPWIADAEAAILAKLSKS
jgi:hypothetical protein